MSAERSIKMAALLVLALLAACGSKQKVSIRTDPLGAEVYLQRRGEIEINANVKGIPGKITANAFEEDFRLLGNAPIEYQFDLSEKDVGIDTPEGGGNIVRHYKEGTIRVEREGYESAIRPVYFSGGTVDLMITLLPLSQD